MFVISGVQSGGEEMKIYLKEGDITREEVCAVVNAANASLLGGGGVDGAIHAAGGPQILQACREIRNRDYPDGLPTGNAVVTTAGEMKAKYVIHTVGPIYTQCKSECERLLTNAYINSMKKALEMGCRSIAFPAISTGIYGYPPAEAAKIAYSAVKNFDDEEIKVVFIFHSPRSLALFDNAIKG
jgi:O-acetyl-ADP-ribose deacetylase (regulator of RNase III)